MSADYHPHIQAVKQQLDALDSELFFVHSDIMRAFPIKLPKFSTEALLQAHYEVLQYITAGADLWFPSFNLNFPKTGIYDVKNTPSEMGHLSEFFRANKATWRNEIPMHSCCGTGPAPKETDTHIKDPWAEDSVWETLVSKKGIILFYGAHLDAISFLHYLEKQLHVPYRYAKQFKGKIIDRDGIEKNTVLEHIVRPMNLDIQYDWEKLYQDLKQAKILLDVSDKRSRIMAIPAGALFDFWKEKLIQNPLYLLTENSRIDTQMMLDKIGHPFVISDFEA